MKAKQTLSVGLVLALLAPLCPTALGAPAGEVSNRVRIVRSPGISKIIKAGVGTDGSVHLLFDGVGGPFYVRSQDGGTTFSSPVYVVDAAARKPGLEFSAWDLAVGADGCVHVALGNNAWKLKLPQEEWGLYYASLAPGAKTFSPLRNINRKPSEGFSVAADGKGLVTACFLSDKLFTMLSRDNGQTFAGRTEPNPAWDPCNCCTTSAAYGPDGRLAVLYREETKNERDMYLVLWDQHLPAPPTRSRVSTTSWIVNACPMTYFTLTPTASGYIAAWPTKGQVFFARLNQDGAVLPPGEIKTPGTHGMRTGLVALSAADGTALVAWKNQDSLGWQLYDANNEPLGKPGSANGPGNGAAGVALQDGRFLLFP